MLLTQQTEAALLALLNGQIPTDDQILKVHELHNELIRRDQVRSRLNTLSAQNKEPTR